MNSIGISAAEFERKTTGMTALNLVQQGGELAYLLLHDPEFRTRTRREHLYEAGKSVRLKPNIDLLYRYLSEEVQGFHFDFRHSAANPFGQLTREQRLKRLEVLKYDHLQEEVSLVVYALEW